MLKETNLVYQMQRKEHARLVQDFDRLGCSTPYRLGVYCQCLRLNQSRAIFFLQLLWR